MQSRSRKTGAYSRARGASKCAARIVQLIVAISFVNLALASCPIPSSTDVQGAFFEVASSAHLAEIGVSCPLDARYLQTQDIVLSPSNWTPIGSLSTPFTGEYDGAENAIEGLRYVHPATSVTDVGLFAVLKDATIRNLEIRDALVSSTDSAGVGIGALAGRVVGTSKTTLEGLVAEATVWMPHPCSRKVSALVGSLEAATVGTLIVRDVTVSGSTVLSGGGAAGGIVGSTGSGPTNRPSVSITDVNVEGTVQATGSHVGGLMGDVGGPVQVANVSVAHVSGTDEYVGGLMGDTADPVFVTGATVTGAVTGNARYVGGALGFVGHPTSIDQLVVQGDVRGTTGVGGVVGESSKPATLTQVTIQGTVTGSGQNVGGLVGSASESLTVDVADVRGAVSSTSLRVGGAVGIVTKGATDLRNVIVQGTVTGAGNVGGIVGETRTITVIHQGHVLGDVSAGGSQPAVGGAIGHVGFSNSAFTVSLTEVAISGNVTSQVAPAMVGGAIGSTVGIAPIASSDVVVFGTVSAPSGAVVGGVVGDVNATQVQVASFRQVLVLGEVTGGTTVGGVAGEQRGAAIISVTDVHWRSDLGPTLTPVGAGSIQGTTEGRGDAALRSFASFDAAAWRLANGRPAVAGPVDAVWTLCQGAFPVLTWLAPSTCPPSMGDASGTRPVAGLHLGGFALEQLRNIPFDVTVSLVDADGNATVASEPSDIVLSASGGVVAGELLHVVDGVALTPRVSVPIGATSVVVEDVFYTGLSGSEGGDVVLLASGLTGSVQDLRASPSRLSVRDVEIRIDVSPSSIWVDGVDRAHVVVTLLTAEGHPLPGERITISTRLGRFVRGGASFGQEVTGVTDGQGRVSWLLDPNGASGVATVTARCPGACTVTIDVPFVGALEDVRAIPGNEEAWLEFAPLGDGVTDVQYRLDGGRWRTASLIALEGRLRIPNLENGRTYRVELQALRGERTLPISEAVSVTPSVVKPPLLELSLPEDLDALQVSVVNGERFVDLPVELRHQGTVALKDVWFTPPILEGWTVVGFTTDVGTVEREVVAWHLRLGGAPLEPGATVTLTLTLKQEVE